MSVIKRLRSPITIALVIGVAAGLATPGIALGFHFDCIRGARVGWSGYIRTPYMVAVPPPGGFVNFTASFWNVTGGYGSTDSRDYPSSNIVVSDQNRNWSLYHQQSKLVVGLGQNPSCPANVLTVSGYPADWATGTLPNTSTPAGIGERSTVPSQYSFDIEPLAGPTAVLNGSYGLQPLLNFSWHQVGVGFVSVTSTEALGNLSISVKPIWNGTVFVGLGLTTNLTEIQFGIPILAQSGSLGIYVASLPSDSPNWGLLNHVTYVFPSSTDQGTWSIYAAGAGSAFPLGGYLFEQTA